MKNRLLTTVSIATLWLLAEGLWVYAFLPHPADASRNSAGTMSVPNTFVTGAASSAPDMNTNFSDFATEMTDSLDRSGKGGMLAALRGIDGTVTAPAFSFTSETGTGYWRNGAGDLRLSILGSTKGFWNAVGLGLSGAAVTYPLEVNGGGDTAASIGISNSLMTGTPILHISMNNGNTAGIFEIQKTSGTPSLGYKFFSMNSGAAVQALTIAAAGGTTANVGLTVGTSGTTISQITTGTGTYNGGTPATFTATVASGAKCVASKVQTGGAAAAAVSVTSTTLTVTSSAAGDNGTANYFCF